jgi:hypothetical protein
MITDFVEYLKTCSSKKIGLNNLFVPDSKIAIGDDDVAKAEKMLNCSLPTGYETFLQTLGTGCWADANVTSPNELYAFDESVGEMCGMIPVAENVDECGSYVAFNPRDQQLYFCCHDPFGYALVASSFEEFI